MEWIDFMERQPDEIGEYLISYDYKTWREAMWNGNKWQGDPDRYGYHTLYSPRWWARVNGPKDDRILFRRFDGNH